LLGISKLDDWYRVSQEDLAKYHAGKFLKLKGGLLNTLSTAYPNFQWDNDKFNRKQKKSAQWWLYKIVRETLPLNIEIIEDFCDPSLGFTNSGHPMIFDVYVPSLQMTFEYQGHQHYHTTNLFGEQMNYYQHDSEKRNACISMGLTLIEVPYWWKRDKESIVALLHKLRPDII